MFDPEVLKEAVRKGNAASVEENVRAALDQEADAADILDRGLIAGMEVVGDRMEKEEMFIPEVLLAAKAMAAGLEVLKPLLGEEAANARGRAVIGTVRGDLHDIGKNLVATMLESGGMEVVDLGVNVSPEAFVDHVREHHPHLLCLSALLTTTMPMMEKTLLALKEAGLRNRVKVLVGGAPVTRKFAEQIGADGYAEDAASATKLAKSLLK